MTDHRADWIETFTSFVQFYPKLSATIAFATMAAAGRMLPVPRPTENALNSSEQAPRLVPAMTAKRPAKKAKPLRRTTKRVNGRQ